MTFHASDENSYHIYSNCPAQAHLGATKGKQGLGRAGAPKKVAGARWSGKKTKIGSDSDEDDEATAAAAAAGVLAEDDTSSSSDEELVVVLASKKEQADGHVRKEVVAHIEPVKQKTALPDDTKDACKQSSEKIKVQWKKEAKKHLKGAPKRRLEIHLLREKMLQEAGLKDDKGKMLKKLSQLPEVFKVCEKFVQLL